MRWRSGAKALVRLFNAIRSPGWVAGVLLPTHSHEIELRAPLKAYSLHMRIVAPEGMRMLPATWFPYYAIQPSSEKKKGLTVRFYTETELQPGTPSEARRILQRLTQLLKVSFWQRPSPTAVLPIDVPDDEWCALTHRDYRFVRRRNHLTHWHKKARRQAGRYAWGGPQLEEFLVNKLLAYRLIVTYSEPLVIWVFSIVVMAALAALGVLTARGKLDIVPLAAVLTLIVGLWAASEEGQRHQLGLRIQVGLVLWAVFWLTFSVASRGN